MLPRSAPKYEPIAILRELSQLPARASEKMQQVTGADDFALMTGRERQWDELCLGVDRLFQYIRHYRTAASFANDEDTVKVYDLLKDDLSQWLHSSKAARNPERRLALVERLPEIGKKAQEVITTLYGAGSGPIQVEQEAIPYGTVEKRRLSNPDDPRPYKRPSQTSLKSGR